MLADARAFLWDAAFPKFQAAGQIGPFLSCLIPHILDGRLTALSPEVVQVSASAPAPAGPETCTRCLQVAFVGGLHSYPIRA